MSKRKIMIATALSGALMMPSVVMADDQRPDKKAEINQEAAEYKHEKHKLFRTLFDAHTSLELEAPEKAEKYLNDAYKQLEAVLEDGADTEVLSETKVSKVVQLTYGNALLPKTVYIPVDDGPLSVDQLTDELKLNGIGRGEVEDADIKYVRLYINKTKLLHELNEAQAELADNDFDSARDQVLDAQQAMFFEFDGSQPPKIVAKDHVALARYMVKIAEYEGAKEAIRSADMAMIDLNVDMGLEGKAAADVNKIRKDMKELEKLIERRDPSLAQQIDNKLESWWNELS